MLPLTLLLLPQAALLPHPQLLAWACCRAWVRLRRAPGGKHPAWASSRAWASCPAWGMPHPCCLPPHATPRLPGCWCGSRLLGCLLGLYQDPDLQLHQQSLAVRYQAGHQPGPVLLHLWTVQCHWAPLKVHGRALPLPRQGAEASLPAPMAAWLLSSR